MDMFGKDGDGIDSLLKDASKMFIESSMFNWSRLLSSMYLKK